MRSKLRGDGVVKACSAGMWCRIPARNDSSGVGAAPLPLLKPSRMLTPSYNWHISQQSKHSRSAHICIVKQFLTDVHMQMDNKEGCSAIVEVK